MAGAGRAGPEQRTLAALTATECRRTALWSGGTDERAVRRRSSRGPSLDPRRIRSRRRLNRRCPSRRCPNRRRRSHPRRSRRPSPSRLRRSCHRRSCHRRSHRPGRRGQGPATARARDPGTGSGPGRATGSGPDRATASDPDPATGSGPDRATASDRGRATGRAPGPDAGGRRGAAGRASRSRPTVRVRPAGSGGRALDAVVGVLGRRRPGRVVRSRSGRRGGRGACGSRPGGEHVRCCREQLRECGGGQHARGVGGELRERGDAAPVHQLVVRAWLGLGRPYRERARVAVVGGVPGRLHVPDETGRPGSGGQHHDGGHARRGGAGHGGGGEQRARGDTSGGRAAVGPARPDGRIARLATHQRLDADSDPVRALGPRLAWRRQVVTMRVHPAHSRGAKTPDRRTGAGPNGLFLPAESNASCPGCVQCH